MLKHSVYLFAAVLLFGFSSCADEDFDPRLEFSGTPSLTSPAPGTDLVIDESNLDGELATFSWAAITTSVPTEVRYVLEADSAGGDFSAPLVLAPSSVDREATVMASTVNRWLLNNGATPNVASTMMVRVRSIIGLEADGRVLISEPVMINVTPFEAVGEVAALYVPGAYQGWMPGADNVGRLFSPEDNGVYDGYVNFGADGSNFKITPEPNWDNDYGDNDADGTLDEKGADITSAGTGYHRIMANINDLTYTQTPTSWGLIGNATATGWDSDTDFEIDPDTGLLTITADLATGEDIGFKFRANDDWGTNFGDTGADGSLEYNGDNLSVEEAGNYTITLDLLGAVPQVTIVKN